MKYIIALFIPILLSYSPRQDDCYKCNAADVRSYINEKTNNSLGTWADDESCDVRFKRYSVVQRAMNNGSMKYACLFKTVCSDLYDNPTTVYIGIECKANGCLKDEFTIVHVFDK